VLYVANLGQQLVIKFVTKLSKVLSWVLGAWDALGHKVPFSYFCGIFGAIQMGLENLNGKGIMFPLELRG
jgi:hypothetical protein